MNRTFKFKTAIVAGIAATAFVHFNMSLKASEDYLCGCETSMQVNTALPLSHPSNVCAAKANKRESVSWASWIAGKSASYQFHYLDLLELLSRSERTSYR